jgi:hypothetical protein
VAFTAGVVVFGIGHGLSGDDSSRKNKAARREPRLHARNQTVFASAAWSYDEKEVTCHGMSWSDNKSVV